MQLPLRLETHMFCSNCISLCLYSHVLLEFDLDTVKMLMNIFVSHRSPQTRLPTLHINV